MGLAAKLAGNDLVRRDTDANIGARSLAGLSAREERSHRAGMVAGAVAISAGFIGS